MVIQKLLVEEGIKRGLKESQKYSVSVLGYDFIGLVSRLAVFFVMAFLINSYFIATIQGGIWLNSLGSFFNMKFPSTLPEWLTQLFTTGYKGFTFWNLVTTISVLIVVVEAMQYDKMLKVENATTKHNDFGSIRCNCTRIIANNIPYNYSKLQERRIINNA